MGVPRPSRLTELRSSLGGARSEHPTTASTVLTRLTFSNRETKMIESQP